MPAFTAYFEARRKRKPSIVSRRCSSPAAGAPASELDVASRRRARLIPLDLIDSTTNPWPESQRARLGPVK
jgi:hypothetical protein